MDLILPFFIIASSVVYFCSKDYLQDATKSN